MCVSVVNGKWLPLLALCVFHPIQQVIKIIITAIVFFVILISVVLWLQNAAGLHVL